MINLDRCNDSCNTLGDPSVRIYVANKTEDVNLNIFNMIAGINIYHANVHVSLMAKNVTQIESRITIKV